MVLAERQGRGARVDVRTAYEAVSVAFAMALTASLAIVAERLTSGAAPFSLAALGMVVAIAIVSVMVARELRTRRVRALPLVALHGVGALAAILLVHGLVLVFHPRALVETPAQLVNDFVLAGAALVFAWSHAARSQLRRMLLVSVAVVSVLAYWATASRWHCDLGPFETSVQRLVVEQVFMVAAVLFSLDLLPTPRGE
jgi:hypothetical protein